ncbi:Dfp1/Him1, central region-domain-containing protein [Cyathus striatus]|nr:Dfp1/Him1, central region-domain-containing protein [Cyathus striatus]
MASLNRKPLANRHIHLSPSPSKPHRTQVKRARSPDHSELNVPKRLRHAEREQRELEFKEKYTRAFPTFTFYLDKENMSLEAALIKVLETRIRSLGGVIEDFFSKHITHLITDQPPLSIPSSAAEKENVVKHKNMFVTRQNPLVSPMKLKRSTMDDVSTGGFDLVAKANSFGIKIWSTNKLESVISRCIDVPCASTVSMYKHSMPQPTTGLTTQRSLSRLLQSERIHGTTERDPTQKRHGFRYFTRGSFFVLVEDLRQELATIAAHEYVIKRGKTDHNPPWPVLHCHPKSRGPFIPFDDREKRRWERLQNMEQGRETEHVIIKSKHLKVAVKEKAISRMSAKAGDLRRTVSLSNFQRRASLPVGALKNDFVDLNEDRDEDESANASGYLALGTATYVAASGNSVGITSTTGTTSTTGYTSRYLQLSSALTERMKQQIVTSCKFPVGGNGRPVEDQSSRPMAPPAVPDKQPMLRKSKSTNTIKLPKREEGSKPGYCESCRTKFEDFKDHINSRRHRNFALNDANFLQLDCVLARVQRRTREELAQHEHEREQRRKMYCSKQ